MYIYVAHSACYEKTSFNVSVLLLLTCAEDSFSVSQDNDTSQCNSMLFIDVHILMICWYLDVACQPISCHFCDVDRTWWTSCFFFCLLPLELRGFSYDITGRHFANVQFISVHCCPQSLLVDWFQCTSDFTHHLWSVSSLYSFPFLLGHCAWGQQLHVSQPSSQMLFPTPAIPSVSHPSPQKFYSITTHPMKTLFPSSFHPHLYSSQLTQI